MVNIFPQTLLICLCLQQVDPIKTPSITKQDNCACIIPADLKTVIEDKFSQYRCPIESDNLQEDIQQNIVDGKNGCLSVVSGDFDGNGKMDYAIILTNKSDQGAFFIVARNTKEGWVVEPIKKMTDGRSRLYVEVIGPGIYKNMFSTREKKYNIAEVPAIRSKRPGVVFGRTEASATAYFWTPKGWVHLYLGD